MSLEIQILHNGETKIIKDTSMIHLTFIDDEKDSIEAVSLSRKELFAAIMAFDEIKRAITNYPSRMDRGTF